MALFRKILSALFPEKCSSCGEVTSTGEVICDECRKNVFPISGDICHRCGAGIDDHDGRSCNSISAPVIAAYYYRDGARSLIIDFKDTLRNDYFDFFSLAFFEKTAREYSDINFDLAVCVPSESKKKTTSELICTETAKRFFIPCDIYVLEKYRKTKKQHRLTAEERRKNLIGSIRVRADKHSEVEGKILLLLDDVKTTGATLDECTKALYAAGAKAVYCACIAVSDYYAKK